MKYFALGVLAAAIFSFRSSAASTTVFVGTYTSRGSEGIYRFELNNKTGELQPRGLAAASKNPSFLAIHPNGKFLFAANETTDFAGQNSGAISAFAIESGGHLTLLNQQPSGGGAPCHLVVDRTGRFVLAANYVGGSAVVLPVGRDGRLGAASCLMQHQGSGPNASRQEAPHAHSVNLDPRNRFAAVADLGLDQVFIYRFDSRRGILTRRPESSARLAPGSGPRHFAFHPDHPFAYSINELLSTVTAFDYDSASGKLTEMQTLSTIPGPVPGNTTADIEMHPSGRFVYGSNRGHDSIAVFAVDPKTGRLKPVENTPTGGKTPRNFGIDPSGRFLLAANQDSDSIVVFRIDPKSGRLTRTGQSVSCPMPVCIRFSPRH